MADIKTAKHNAGDVQSKYFETTDQVPTEVWYWAAVGSILGSAVMFLAGKRDVSIFIGQWPPTFLLFAVFHKLMRSR